MPIKTIIELQARPGHRDDLTKAMNDVLDDMKNAPGFIDMKRYEVIDNQDSLIEITEWESPEARQTWLQQSMESGVLSRLMGTLGMPFKAITIKEMK